MHTFAEHENIVEHFHDIFPLSPFTSLYRRNLLFMYTIVEHDNIVEHFYDIFTLSPLASLQGRNFELYAYHWRPWEHCTTLSLHLSPHPSRFITKAQFSKIIFLKLYAYHCRTWKHCRTLSLHLSPQTSRFITKAQFNFFNFFLALCKLL